MRRKLKNHVPTLAPAARARSPVRPSAVQSLLEDAVRPVRGEPRIALEELDSTRSSCA